VEETAKVGQRRNVVGVRFSDDELRDLDAKAQAEGLSRNSWLRSQVVAILRGSRKTVAEESRDLLRGLMGEVAAVQLYLHETATRELGEAGATAISRLVSARRPQLQSQLIQDATEGK
jgi:hypothetical protein